MTENQDSKGVPPWLADERMLAWMEEHATEMRQLISGQRILYESLVACFVVGLAAQMGGYALLASTPGEPLGLLADLLHALGWSLWTGVVVAFYIQIFPEVKRRQIRQALDAYEALRREQAQAGGHREGPGVE
jgi:putative copper export protein